MDTFLSHLWNNLYSIIGLILTLWFSIFSKKWEKIGAQKKEQKENLKENLKSCSELSRCTFLICHLMENFLVSTFWLIWGTGWLIISFIAIRYSVGMYLSVGLSITSYAFFFYWFKGFERVFHGAYKLYLDPNPNKAENPGNRSDNK